MANDTSPTTRDATKFPATSTRRKQAVVALARKILIWCWAILRDGGTWVEDHRPAKAPPGPTPVPA